MKESNNEDRINCCICKREIPEHPAGTGWMLGNNAEPVVKEGRCCNNCNYSSVLPARGMSGDMIENIISFNDAAWHEKCGSV